MSNFSNYLSFGNEDNDYGDSLAESPNSAIHNDLEGSNNFVQNEFSSNQYDIASKKLYPSNKFSGPYVPENMNPYPHNANQEENEDYRDNIVIANELSQIEYTTESLNHNPKGSRFLFHEKDYSFNVFRYSWHFNTMNSWNTYGVYVEDGVDYCENESVSNWRSWKRLQTNSIEINNNSEQYQKENITNSNNFDNNIINQTSFVKMKLNENNETNANEDDKIINSEIRLGGSFSSQLNISNGINTEYLDSLRRYHHFTHISGSDFSDGVGINVGGSFINWSEKNMILFSSIGKETIFQDNIENSNKDVDNPSNINNKQENKLLTVKKQLLFIVDPNDPKLHTAIVTPHKKPIKGINHNSTVSGGGEILTFDENSVVVWNTPHSTACINDLECQNIALFPNILCVKWINRDYVYLDNIIQGGNTQDLHSKYEKKEKFVEGIPHGRASWIAVSRSGLVQLNYRTIYNSNNNLSKWESSEIHLNSCFQHATIEISIDGSILIAGIPIQSSLIYTYILSVIPKLDSNYLLVLKKTISPISLLSGIVKNPSLNNHLLFHQFVPFSNGNSLIISLIKEDTFYLHLYYLDEDSRIQLSAAFQNSKPIIQSRWKLKNEKKLKSRPTCFSFTKDGLWICIGYIDGSFEVRELNSFKTMYKNFSLQRISRLDKFQTKKRKLESKASFLPFPLFGASFSPNKTLLSIIDFECKIHVFVLPLYKPQDITSIVERSFLNYYDSWDIFYLLKCWIVEGKSDIVRENINHFYSTKPHLASSSVTFYGQVYERFLSIAYRLLGGEDLIKSIQFQSDIQFPILLRIAQLFPKQINDKPMLKLIFAYMYLWLVFWSIVFLHEWKKFFDTENNSDLTTFDEIVDLDTSIENRNKYNSQKKESFYLISDRYVDKYLGIMESLKSIANEIIQLPFVNINKNLRILNNNLTEIKLLHEFLQKYISIKNSGENTNLSHQLILENMQKSTEFKEIISYYFEKIAPLIVEINCSIPAILSNYLDLVPQLRGRISVKDEFSKSIFNDNIKDFFTKEYIPRELHKYCKICSRATYASHTLFRTFYSIIFQKSCPSCGSHYVLV